MAKPIEYHVAARQDFDESFDWYAQRGVGAVLGFTSSVDEALERIAAGPGRFASTHGGCRSCPLSRYPFRIVFREEANRIVVIAVAHAKRRPGYWRGRV